MLCRVAFALALVGAVGFAQEPDPMRLLTEARSRLQARRPDQALPLFAKSAAAFDKSGNTSYAASAFGGIGECQFQLGRFAEMRKAYAECLRRLKATHGDRDHRDIARAMDGLVRSFLGTGQRAKALELCKETLAMQKRLFGDKHPDILRTLGNMVACLVRGRPSSALPHAKDSVSMAKKLDTPADLAYALNNLAACYYNLDRPAAALPHNREALQIRKRLYNGDHPQTATSMANVAACLNHSKAAPYYERALAMRRRLYPSGHPDVASSLTNISTCYANLARYTEALKLSEESAAMWARLFPTGHPNHSMALNSVAGCLQALGRPYDALPNFQRALALHVRFFPADLPQLALYLTNMAACLMSLGRTSDALPQFKKALAIAERSKASASIKAAAMASLAGCLGELDRYQEALPLLQRALAIRKARFKSPHESVAAAHQNVAVALRYLERSAEALPHAKSSVTLMDQMDVGDHPLKAACLDTLGLCLHDMKRPAESLRFLKRALAMCERLGFWGTHLRAANVGQFLIANGRPQEAVPYYERAIAQIEGQRRAASGLEEQDRAAYFQQLRRVDVFQGMVEAQFALGNHTDALRYAERGRARSLLDLLERSRFDALAEAQRRARGRGDAEALKRIRAAEGAVEQAEDKIRRISRVGPAEQLPDARRAHREALRTRARLVRDFVPDAGSLTPDRMQQSLQDGEWMLLYLIAPQGSLVFAVPPKGGAIRAHVLVRPDRKRVKADELRQLIEAYLRSILVGGGRTRGLGLEEDAEAAKPDLGTRLFKALVPDPVWKEIRGAKRVYLVPHGALHRLPFETLQVKKGKYWLDEGPPIVYGASATTLLRKRKQRTETRHEHEVVALGDPVFSAAQGEVPDPPATGITIQAVMAGSHADKAGLKVGDVIRAYDGVDTPDLNVFGAQARRVGQALASGQRESKTVALKVWRAGKQLELTLQIGRLGIQVFRVPPPDAFKVLRQGSPQEAQLARLRSGLAGRHGKLERLPGTRREVLAIKKALGDRAKVLLGEDATRTKLFELAPKARYLHIATHYLADETEGASYSSLALTVPKKLTKNDDGFLRLIDVLERWRGRLTNCELVVLSACETQKGRMQKDEAVFAMPVGFQFAGAPSVIASLWRVEDESTADLFSDFYKRLAKGKGKLQAFTEARKALRKQRPEPYFWAPFIYMGDPR